MCLCSLLQTSAQKLPTLLASSPLPANSPDPPLFLLLLIPLQLGSTFNFSKSFHIHFLIWPFQQSCEVGRASTIIPIWKMGEMKYNALKWWALSDVSHSQLGPGLNLGSPMALHGESLCWILVYRYMYLYWFFSSLCWELSSRWRMTITKGTSFSILNNNSYKQHSLFALNPWSSPSIIYT